MLNKDQQAIAEEFRDFLFSDDKEFLIDASAGYGKSYLMKHLATVSFKEYLEGCKAINVEPKYRDIALTATTNKAAESLETATGMDTSTIQSLFGLIVRPDFEKGTTELKKSNKTSVICNTVIFIDECSMVDSKLLEFINELTHECKIIYVGDKYQLTPVKSGLSPVYSKHLKEHTLTIPMRNANHQELIDLCNQLKETVITEEFKPIKLYKGIIDLYDNDLIAQAYKQEFVDKNGNEARSLTYTNKQAVTYNNYIKNLRGQTEVYNDGDYYIANSVCCLGNKTIHVEDEVYIERVFKRGIQRSLAEGYPPVSLTEALVKWHGIELHVALPESYMQIKALLKMLSKDKKWYQYFAIKEGYLDLRPRDACTIHKAQGSTLETVFIDANDLSTCTQSGVTARLLYVACSRAKSHIIFYGDLKRKYGLFCN